MTAPQSPAHPLTQTRWGVVILAALVVFGPLSIDLYLPALPEIGKDLGVGAGPMQWTLSGFLVGFCVGMLIYGPVSDTVGRRPVVLFGVALFIVASLACAFAETAQGLIVLRFCQAFGGGAAAVMGRAIVRDIFPRDQAARVLSLVALVTAVTPMLAPLVGGQILYLANWRAIFAVLAIYGVGAFALTWFAIPEPLPKERRGGLRLSTAMAVYGHLLVDRAAWGCILCSAGIYAAMFAYIAGTPFVYIDYFQVSPQLYGFLFGVNIVSQMGFTFLNSRLVGRYDLLLLSRWGSAVALLGGTGLLAAGLLDGGVVAIMLPLLLVVGMTVVLSSNMTARIMALYPNNVGAAAAALTSLSFGAGAISSFLVSVLNDGSPLAMCAVVFGFCVLTAVGTLPVFQRRR